LDWLKTRHGFEVYFFEFHIGIKRDFAPAGPFQGGSAYDGKLKG